MKNQDTYQLYLNNKHSRFNTPPEIIESVVKKATGELPQSQKKLILGEDNEVYDVNLGINKNVIVRISRSSRPRFLAEKWAIDQCHKVEVPAPIILHIENQIIGNQSLSFCVEEKIPGQPMNSLMESDSKSNEWQQQLIEESGEILAKIHSVVTSGYGSLDPNGQGEFSSWSGFMLNSIADNSRLLLSARNIGLNSQHIDKSVEILHKYADVYKQIEPRLLLGDYGPKHFLIDNDHICGVIDFEGCKSGDIARDFAWWEYFRGDSLPLSWLKAGYQHFGHLGDNFELRLHLCLISLGLSLIDYYENENNIGGMNHSRNQQIKNLKYFETI